MWRITRWWDALRWRLAPTIGRVEIGGTGERVPVKFYRGRIRIVYTADNPRTVTSIGGEPIRPHELATGDSIEVTLHPGLKSNVKIDLV